MRAIRAYNKQIILSIKMYYYNQLSTENILVVNQNWLHDS